MCALAVVLRDSRLPLPSLLESSLPGALLVLQGGLGVETPASLDPRTLVLAA